MPRLFWLGTFSLHSPSKERKRSECHVIGHCYCSRNFGVGGMEKQLKKLTLPIQKLVSAHARWAFFHKTEPDSAKQLCEELEAFLEEGLHKTPKKRGRLPPPRHVVNQSQFHNKVYPHLQEAALPLIFVITCYRLYRGLYRLRSLFSYLPTRFIEKGL